MIMRHDKRGTTEENKTKKKKEKKGEKREKGRKKINVLESNYSMFSKSSRILLL